MLVGIAKARLNDPESVCNHKKIFAEKFFGKSIIVQFHDVAINPLVGTLRLTSGRLTRR